MGLVYRVHHRSWNIDLVVKSPRPEIVARYGEEDFIREANTWVELGLHPHIVSCYYVRKIDNLPRVFAEFVEGGSLKDWIEDKRLYAGGHEKALERILDIAIQFAWGLGYAHEKGLVHQDVKPGNVLMTEDGMAKVTDFGLARARSRTEDRPTDLAVSDGSVSVAGGTVAYMSPEQSAGKRLTLKTDMWSWAVSLLEMLLGERTWLSGVAAPDAMEEYLADSGQANDLSQQKIPAALVDLLRDCFRSYPELRPADMLEITARLQEIYQQETAQAYPRQMPKAAELRADSLNNKALSFLDIGQREKAMVAWHEALLVDPHHPEATYNQGLTCWREGQITDENFLEKLREIRATHANDWLVPYLQAQVNLERGDGTSAYQQIRNIQIMDANKEEVTNALKLANCPESNRFRLLQTFEGHTDGVTSVALSSDKRFALSGSIDSTLRLWDITNGVCLRTFEGHTGPVSSVDLSNDGRFALSGSRDKTLKIWDIASGRCLRTFEGHAHQVNTVCLSIDRRYALSGSNLYRPWGAWSDYKEDKRTIKLWDIESGRCLRVFEGHTDDVYSVCLNADGRYALSGSSDNTLKLWDVESGHCLRTFQNGGTRACLSTDGRYAISGGNPLKLWDVESGRCLRTFSGYTDSVLAVCFNSNRRYALSVSADKSIRLWEVATGRCIRTFVGHKRDISSIFISMDDSIALTGSLDGTLKLWDLRLEINFPKAPLMLSRVQSIKEIVLAQDMVNRLVAEGQKKLAQGETSEAARQIQRAMELPGFSRSPVVLQVWRQLYICLPRISFREGWEVMSLQGHTAAVNSVCMSPDGRYALSGSSDKTLKLWELERGCCLLTYEGHTSDVNSVCLSADGRYALSGSKDKTLKLWDIESGRCLSTCWGGKWNIDCVSLSADGRYALSGGGEFGQTGDTLNLFDMKSGVCLRTYEGHKITVNSAHLSVDMRYAVSGSADGTLKLWDVPSGRCLRTFKGHTQGINWEGVQSVFLSTDGDIVLSGCADKTIRLWDVLRGRCLSIFEGHTSIVRSVHLSTDGRYALSGADDKTVKLWEVANGNCLRTFEGHTAGITSVWLSADGCYALSGSADHTVRLWALVWGLQNKETADWDAGAKVILEHFLIAHASYAGQLPPNQEPTDKEITSALTHRGKPTWTEEDFQRLLYTLGCAGYGWLRPEGVRRKLEEMAKERANG
jgi:WD40 repeat protein/serine/threonine protein kinase